MSGLIAVSSLNAAALNYDYMQTAQGFALYNVLWVMVDAVAFFCLDLCYVMRLQIFVQDPLYKKLLLLLMIVPTIFAAVDAMWAVRAFDPDMFDAETQALMDAVPILMEGVFHVITHVALCFAIFAEMGVHLSTWGHIRLFSPCLASGLFLFVGVWLRYGKITSM